MPLCYILGLTCKDFDGVPLVAHNQNHHDYDNPSVCCPKSCGRRCNECQPGAGVLPDTCLDNMCNEMGNENKCCASSIPRNKICSGTDSTPCRLSKLLTNSYQYWIKMVTFYFYRYTA